MSVFAMQAQPTATTPSSTVATKPQKKSPMQKQIPTLVGVGILLVSLVAGLLMFGKGTGVFAPRASAEETPKSVRTTNVTDKSFTISFYTDAATAGFVKYGTDANALKNQASDDRDQLSGSIGDYRLHHITVRGLEPGTKYYYVLGTGSKAEHDNNGAPFTLTTPPALADTPPTSKTVYGTVKTSGGTPANGSVVFISMQGVGELSSLVKSSGSWAVALGSARTADGSSYADISDETTMSVIVQGIEPTQTALLSTNVSDAQPIPELILGTGGAAVQQQGTTTGGGLTPDQIAAQKAAQEPASTPTPTSGAGGVLDSLTDDSSTTGAEKNLLDDSTKASESSAAAEINLDEVAENDTPVLNTQPVFTGKAAPSVEVSIEIHSDNQILQTVTANESGEFSLDLSKIREQLDPGEHTIAYTYTDPTTGQDVTKTQTFIVEDESALLAQAGITKSTSSTSSSTSFGSGNPVPLDTPTPTPTKAPVTESTDSASATRSAMVATDSGVYTSGSVGETFMLIAGGLFFVFAGWWSWWLANEARKVV